MAIILFDLDELKYTNDNYGHREGDALIKAIAGRLNQFSAEIQWLQELVGMNLFLLCSTSE